MQTESWQVPTDPEKREGLQIMLQDIIALKRSKKETVRQELLDRLAAIREFEAAGSVSVGIASAEVFGHPLATNLIYKNMELADLIPIRDNDKSNIAWRIDKAQEIVNELSSRRVCMRGGKPADESSKFILARLAKNKQMPLNDTESVILELLQTETLPELNRLYKILPERS